MRKTVRDVESSLVLQGHGFGQGFADALVELCSDIDDETIQQLADWFEAEKPTLSEATERLRRLARRARERSRE